MTASSPVDVSRRFGLLMNRYEIAVRDCYFYFDPDTAEDELSKAIV